MLKNKFGWAIIILVLFFAIRYYYEKHLPIETHSTEIVTVAASPATTRLFYAGTIQPLKSTIVSSPAEGIISEMNFHYGDDVKKDQTLFVVSSAKFQSDYKSALLQYIKTKTEFDNSHSQLVENEFLHKNQLISDDTFKEKKSAFFTAQLNLIQAKDTLLALLKQLDLKGLTFENLNIQDIDKINNLLHEQNDSQYIHIASPVAGVALLPIQEGNNLNVKFNKGSPVKQGDVLAMIGDVSGLTVRISVNEFNVNQLKVGQTVKVTGVAFPDITLVGNIVGIDHQGQTSSGGGMPLFPVEIAVDKLTAEQMSIIHIGMSAKVEIDITNPPQLSVPIEAVHEKSGINYVNVQKKENNKTVEVPVNPGQTTPTNVVIQSGIQSGDRVVVSH